MIALTCVYYNFSTVVSVIVWFNAVEAISFHAIAVQVIPLKWFPKESAERQSF